MRIFAALAAAIGVRMAFTSPLPVQMEEEDRTGEAARVGATALLVGEVLGGSVASYVRIAWRSSWQPSDHSLPSSSDHLANLTATLHGGKNNTAGK